MSVRLEEGEEGKKNRAFQTAKVSVRTDCSDELGQVRSIPGVSANRKLLSTSS